MNRRKSLTRGNEKISVGFWYILIVFIAVCLLFVRIECPNVRDAADRYHCQRNMTAIWTLLIEFVEENGDIPRNDSGEFSLSALSAPPVLLSCPSSGQPYLVFPFLEPDQIDPVGASNSVVPILFDAAHAHVTNVSEGSMLPMLLLSNGRVITWPSTVDEYRKWTQAYSSGSTAEGRFPPRR